MAAIFDELKRYLEENNGRRLVSIQMLDRMIKRVEGDGVDERELIIKALNSLERSESRESVDAFELATRNRRELNKHFDAIFQQANRNRDALSMMRIKRLQKLLLEPPATTRSIDNITLERAIFAFSHISARNKTLQEVATYLDKLKSVVDMMPWNFDDIAREYIRSHYPNTENFDNLDVKREADSIKHAVYRVIGLSLTESP